MSCKVQLRIAFKLIEYANTHLANNTNKHISIILFFRQTI